MSKIKLLTVAVIGLLIINLGMVAFLFFRKPPPPPGGNKPPLEKQEPKYVIIDRLHFSKEQVAKYEALIQEHQSAIKKKRDEIKTAKDNLYRTLADENFAGKDSLIEQLAILQKQIEQVHYDHFAAIRKLCTPDQVSDFNKLTNDLARFFAPGKKEGPPSKD